MIFVRYPFNCSQKFLNFDVVPVSAERLRESVESYIGYNDFALYHNGRKLQNYEIIPDNSTVHITFSLLGGKGGFGSMLRAIGAQIEKTTNREACRDLSGRRLRDINEEQRLKKWIAKEAEREAEKVKRRQARIERLKSKAPHKFFDYDYEKEISELPERISEALNEGLQKAKLPQKRPHEKLGGTNLPKKSWFSDDLPLSSSDSDSDENNSGKESSPSKKQKIIPLDSGSCDSGMSESFQPQPCSSKDYPMEDSLSNDTSSDFRQSNSEESSSTDSEKINVIQLEENKVDENEQNIEMQTIPQGENRDNSKAKEINLVGNETSSASNMSDSVSADEENLLSNETKKYNDTSASNMRDSARDEGKSESKETKKCDDSCAPNNRAKQPEVQDDLPIELLDYGSTSDLEALGLDRLKSALMSRGLKCGGTLSDRAQRLWRVRGLQPHEYPANLLAKNKK